MKPIDITGTVRDAFSIGIGKNKSEFGVFYGSLYFRNFEDNAWKKIASLQDISSSTKDFSWKSNTLYAVNSLIEYTGVFYKCTEEHQSGVSFATDLLDLVPKWQEIGFYGNLKLINIETRTSQDFYLNLNKFDDNVIIYGNNTEINATFKVFLPQKTKVEVNKIFTIQNASYNKVEIYYYNNTVFSNSAFGDYVGTVQLISVNENDNNTGTWNIKFSNNRPTTKIGEWKNSETYRVNDIVRVGYFLYTCIQNHVSSANIINGFNLDYETNKWIYSGGAYAGGTYSLSDRMPINLKSTGSREIYQLDMLSIPFQGNSPESVMDLKNRRVLANNAPNGTPRANTTTVSALLSDLINNTGFRNKSTGDILRYIYKNYKPYEGANYSSAIKLINGVPGKKYILLIKSDGGPYLFDNNIIFSSYGNNSSLAPSGTTGNNGNWFLTIQNLNAKKVIADGLTLSNSNYPVDPFDAGMSKDTYKGNIFPVQSDPGKIDAFEFVCLDYYSDQSIRPGSSDLFLARYLGSYNMGDTFPLRLTPFLPVIGGPGQDEDTDLETYIPSVIDYITLNSQNELFLSVGQTLDDLTIIVNIIKGTKEIASLRLSYIGSILADIIPNPNGGEETFNTINAFSLNSPGTIKIKALVGDGKTSVMKEANMNFVYKIYWGFHANETLTSEQITELQYNQLKNNIDKETFYFETNPDYDVSEYIYFCYPATYNDILFVEDTIASFNYNAENFEITTINLTNEFDSTTQYKIYRTKVKTYGGNFTWRVNLT
jgi:hypothetical protein